jgi:hypothetical protein
VKTLGLNPGACDLAAVIEVIEHLQPSQAANLAHSVLGGLRPKTAIFTTPNWEYNRVLRALSGPGFTWPGPPGRDGLPLRHGDHKFEWTRVEFQGWAAGLAEQHGYDVTFLDIGKAVKEEEVLAAVGSAAAAAAAAAAARVAAPDERVMSQLPEAPAAAPVDVTVASEAAAAALMAVEQVAAGASVTEQVTGACADDSNTAAWTSVAGAGRNVQGAQDNRPGGGIGGASQAALFHLKQQQQQQPDSAATATAPGGAAIAAAAAAAAGGGGGGGQVASLQVLWGPRTAHMTVGKLLPAVPTATESGGREATAATRAAVEVMTAAAAAADDVPVEII